MNIIQLTLWWTKTTPNDVNAFNPMNFNDSNITRHLTIIRRQSSTVKFSQLYSKSIYTKTKKSSEKLFVDQVNQPKRCIQKSVSSTMVQGETQCKVNDSSFTWSCAAETSFKNLLTGEIQFRINESSFTCSLCCWNIC